MVKYIVENGSQVSNKEGLEGTLREPCAAGGGVGQRYQVVSEKGRREGERQRIQYDLSVCASVSVRASPCVHSFQLRLLGKPGSNAILLDLLSTQFLAFKCSSSVKETRLQD